MIYKKNHPSGVLTETVENGIRFFRVPLLDETGAVRCAFSTREGGVSEGIFTSMNFSSDRGDDPEKVRENYRRFSRLLKADPDRIVSTCQTHTANVRIVREEDAGKGFSREKDYRDVDGLVTDVPELPLMIFYADCVPILFVDPVRKVAAAAHSGWRGTKARIGAVTVRCMQETFGCDPADIRAVIGPSICLDCYEVGDELPRIFAQTWPEEEMQQIFRKKPGEEYHLDLWKANELILRDAGLRPEHLAVTDVCTACNPGQLFSHRATGGKRGTMAAMIVLNG